ncbi:hypothetical protein KFK09_024106 [Dendrobium nobile]|uniref:Syringolide-induced protein 14-1-1 n=1 Tax=Dendrobium nobile TaxID=94219 RepID=A0A8T3ABS2_DENNO|nr:hypothetical protein KFK09_024106 [Dendrobium nobile]
MARAGRSKAASKMSYFAKAGTFSVSNPPHSPGRRSDRGFSGPIVSIIPKDVQHKKRSNSGGGAEPTSPKISCMGQIKDKTKKKKKNKKKKEKGEEKQTEKPSRRLCSSCFKGLFRRRVRPGGVPHEKEVEEKMEMKRVPKLASAAPAPRLGQLRRYQSGRETLAGFDWRRTMGQNYGDEGEEEDEDDDVFIPHSAPILVGGGAVALEPKKEVNLWRRRDMPPPLPLQIQKK